MDMIERLWRHDALRVHLSSHVAAVVASAVVLMTGQPATAQYTSDFEAPLYAGSADGTIITGQDAFYVPVPDSQDGLVYTYAGNALGLPRNPSGTETNLQFAGVTGGDIGLPVPFARAQRDVVYGDGTGVWTVSFDIAATYIGVLPSAQNIGSFSTQVFLAEATFIALARWTNPDTASNWNADYVWFDAEEVQLNEEVADPGFQTLLVDHWYRWSTTFNLGTNQIVEVSITDLTTGVTTSHSPVDRYLVGGAAGGADPPSGFRLFGGSNVAAGNTLGFDNLNIDLASGTPSGACCFVDETCEFLTEADCGAAGGIYQGDWTACTEMGCIIIPEECGQGAGPCNEPNGTPGCDIDLCCALVCNLDPFCCSGEWNQTCVDIAAELPQCIVVDVPEGFFVDPAEFNAALKAAGKVVKGTEDFPWEAGGGGVIGIDDPLDVNTAVPGWIQPGVLLDNVTYQSNLDPFGANGPNPRGATGLALFTSGFLGASSNGLVANHFADSLDILSGPPAGDNHTAMAMTLVSFNNVRPGGTVTVTVYDKDENVLGSATNLPAPVNGGLFLGLLFPGDVTIGRVNLYDTTPGFDAEGVYDLTVYVLGGEPCLWDLDGSGDVGVGDLLLLLANWANPYGVPDLCEMLAAWGPCP